MLSTCNIGSIHSVWIPCSKFYLIWLIDRINESWIVCQFVSMLNVTRLIERVLLSSFSMWPFLVKMKMKMKMKNHSSPIFLSFIHKWHIRLMIIFFKCHIFVDHQIHRILFLELCAYVCDNVKNVNDAMFILYCPITNNNNNNNYMYKNCVLLICFWFLRFYFIQTKIIIIIINICAIFLWNRKFCCSFFLPFIPCITA